MFKYWFDYRNFNLSGKTPEERDLLPVFVKGEMIKAALILCSWFRASLSVLIIVQRDATQSSPFIILRVRSTCFGCQPHPSSGVRTPDDGCG